jgi:phenylalanyl-tRNA synthetase beta chain
LRHGVLASTFFLETTMRVPLSWLRDFVDIDLSIDEVAELLTNAGLEVESITRIGLPGARTGVGPRADRARPHSARGAAPRRRPAGAGDGRLWRGRAETVVTGAPNLFQYLGRGDLSDEHLYSPFALEGRRSTTATRKGASRPS